MTQETQQRDVERLEARLERIEAALARLEGLDRLVARLDRIEASVDAVGTFAERLPILADAAGAGVAWAAREAAAQGIDPIETGVRGAQLAVAAARPEALAIAEQLTSPAALASAAVLTRPETLGLVADLAKPETLRVAADLASPDNLRLAGELAEPQNVALVRRLLARRPLVTRLLDALDGAKDDEVVEVATRGVGLTGALLAVLRSPTLAKLLASAADPATLGTAEHAATALVDARKGPPEEVGLFGTLGKLGDADVQRAVGFTFALAKRFGQLLRG